MKKQFPGYYRPSEKEIAENFKSCVFVFDTNVLLNLYRYTPESQANLLAILKNIKDRVWLPYQVGLEYQRGRVSELVSQLRLCDDLQTAIDNLIKGLDKYWRGSNLFASNALIESITQDLMAIKEKIAGKKGEHPDVMVGDSVFDALTDLFDGKVGQPFPAERLADIYKVGKARYDAKTPPGYEDRSKDPNDLDQFGDLVIWFQMLDFAKQEARPIVFVTDDAKEDWWREVHGMKLGPRPELMDEFLRVAGEGKSFYIYSTEQFLRHANEYLSAEVKPEAIKEAEEFEKKDTARVLSRSTYQDAVERWGQVLRDPVLEDARRYTEALEKLHRATRSPLEEEYRERHKALEELSRATRSPLMEEAQRRAQELEELRRATRSPLEEEYRERHKALEELSRATRSPLMEEAQRRAQELEELRRATRSPLEEEYRERHKALEELSKATRSPLLEEVQRRAQELDGLRKAIGQDSGGPPAPSAG